MNKHTPGPWAQGITLHTKQTAQWSPQEIARNNETEQRMVFSGFSRKDDGRSRRRVAVFETKEDARLGAAAPELLEALHSVLDRLEWLNDPRCGNTELPWINQAKAAIAKATGND